MTEFQAISLSNAHQRSAFFGSLTNFVVNDKGYTE